MENRRPTQAKRILEYMRRFGGITQLEALRELGVMRLASRTSELRAQGYEISGGIETVKNRYGEKCRIKRYTLREEAACGRRVG